MELNEKEKVLVERLRSGKSLCGPLCRGNVNLENVYLSYNNLSGPPECIICESPCKFNCISKGYFSSCCSDECKAELNRRKFKKYNKNLAKDKQNRFKEFCEKCGEKIKKEYLETDITGLELSEKYNDYPKSYVLQYLRKEGLTEDYRTRKWYPVQQKTLHTKLKTAIVNISDEQFRNDCIKQQLTAKEIAEIIDCSPNYVVTEFSKYGTPLKQKTTSSVERKLVSLLSDYIDNIVQNNRKVIPPSEVDIYLPDHNVAIEVNGVHWHSQKPRNYHLNKTEAALNANIDLLHFTDTEILNSSELVKSIILNKCGKSPNRIFARKCECRNIDIKTYRNFLIQNHIRGFCGASIKYGLFYKEELISIMSFGVPRFSKQYDFELIRFCNKIDTSVIGGASKLFTQFKRDNPGKSCISYCDRALFSGGFHEKLGFECIRKTPPNYMWVSKTDIKTRYQTQKHKLNTNLTENAYMESKGYKKIYDSGQLAFVYK